MYIKKGVIITFITAILLLASNNYAFAIDKLFIAVNGNIVGFPDQQPFIDNSMSEGRVMVPLRFVSEKLEYQVNWDGNNKEITVIDPYDKKNKVVLWVNKPDAVIKGQRKKMDTIPIITDNNPQKSCRAMVPLRYIAECFGGEVYWWESNDKKIGLGHVITWKVTDKQRQDLIDRAIKLIPPDEIPDFLTDKDLERIKVNLGLNGSWGKGLIWGKIAYKKFEQVFLEAIERKLKEGQTFIYSSKSYATTKSEDNIVFGTIKTEYPDRIEYRDVQFEPYYSEYGFDADLTWAGSTIYIYPKDKQKKELDLQEAVKRTDKISLIDLKDQEIGRIKNDLGLDKDNEYKNAVWGRLTHDIYLPRCLEAVAEQLNENQRVIFDKDLLIKGKGNVNNVVGIIVTEEKDKIEVKSALFDVWFSGRDYTYKAEKIKEGSAQVILK